ncbi:MAG: 30S ribosomal protein S15 [Euryarchaeota archaeon]|nr:30S ribosomal protein S15 [Euryarchaeota archaeon]
MARMHARRRGRSASRRPLITENPEWVSTSKDEIEEIVVKLARDGTSSARIGIVLRDQYAVPDVKLATGMTISEIISENDLRPTIPDDLSSLMRKAIAIQSHLTNNKKDIDNKRSMQLVESKIRRLVRYYKREGRLPANWQYSIKTAELLLE